MSIPRVNCKVVKNAGDILFPILLEFIFERICLIWNTKSIIAAAATTTKTG